MKDSSNRVGSTVSLCSFRLSSALVLAWALCPSAGAQAIKLSGPMTSFERGDVVRKKLSPDGRTIVYLANHDAYSVHDLYAVAADGSSAPRRLSASLATDTSLTPMYGSDDFQIAPDGEHTVYTANTTDISLGEAFFSVRNDGSAPPVPLFAPTFNSSVTGFLITPDGDQVVFSANLESYNQELYRVPIDGSSAPVRLHPQLSNNTGVSLKLLAPDGSRAFYTQQLSIGGNDAFDLFSVRIDGSQLPVHLVGPLGGSGVFVDFAISADGATLIYTAHGPGYYDSVELFSVPTDGSRPAVRLNGPMVASGNIALAYQLLNQPGTFQISPDGRWVVYAADQRADGVFELFRVPIAGGEPPLRISRRSSETGGVTRFEFTPQGQTIVFQTRRNAGSELHVVPLEPRDRMTLGRGFDRQLNVPLAGILSRLDWKLAAGGQRVVYVLGASSYRLFSIALDPSANPVQLNGPLVPGGSVGSFELSSDGQQVAYIAEQNARDVYDLFRVSADGSQAPIQLNDPFPSVSSYPREFSFSADGSRVVYIASHDDALASELFSVPADRSTAPVRLSSNPPDKFGNVLEFRFTPGGDRALYLASQDKDFEFDLYSAPTDGSAPATLLSDPEVPGASVTSAYQLSPDGSQVYFVDNRELNPGFLPQFLLYGVPTDGSAAPRRLVNRSARRVVPTIRVSPDGTHIAYLSTEVRESQVDLFSVPTDGSQLNVRLSTDQTIDAWVQEDFQITSDGARVVFRRTPSRTATVADLFSVALTGGLPPVQLGTSVPAFQLSPDGRRVIFVSGGTLHTVPVDGSQPALSFPGTLSQYGGYLFRVGSASLNVVYATTTGLFSAPIDDSATAISLSSGLPTPEYSLQLSAGAAFYQPVTATLDLYGAAIDGSRGPTRINPPLLSTSSIRSFVLSAGRVVYIADQDQDEVEELYSVQTSGSANPIKLNPPLVHGGDVIAAQISPDGQTVVYLADQEQDDVFHLYAVPIQGGASVRLSGPMTVGGDVLSFTLGAGRRVLYLADQDTADTLELYSSSY